MTVITMNLIWIYLFEIYVHIITRSADAVTGSSYSVLMTEMERTLSNLSLYDPRIIPQHPDTGVLAVSVMLSPWQILDLNEKDQTLTSVMWAGFSWQDYRLGWDPEDYGGVTFIHVTGDQLWRPDLFLQNGVGKKQFFYSMDKDSLLGVSHEGIVDWFPIQMVETSCEVNVATYPFDTQECYYQVGSWMYSELFLTLQFKDNATEISIPYLIPNSEWEVVSTRLQSGYMQFTNGFPMKLFILKLKRRVSFYTFALLMPCILLTLLTMMVFFIPPHTGEKISLGVAVWTSLMVFLLILVEVIPANSNILPLLGMYNTFTLIMVTMSLVFSIFTTRIYYHSAKKPVPSWVHWVVFKGLGRLMCMSRCSCCGLHTAPKDHYKTALQTSNGTLYGIANALGTGKLKQRSSSNSAQAASEIHLGGPNLSDYVKGSNVDPEISREMQNVSESNLFSIRRLLEKIWDGRQEEAKEKTNMAAWEDVAEVVDRFLFWVFLFVTTMFTFFMFYLYTL